MTTSTQARPESARSEDRSEPLWGYVLLGAFLGTVFVKSEVVSWFRIQEMFRFQSFHMYGVIASAVVVGAISIALMRRRGTRTAWGDAIVFPDRSEARPRPNHLLGGTCFGLGWALLGACPGPIFTLIGTGIPVMALGLLSAVGGAWVYGLLRPSLPH